MSETAALETTHPTLKAAASASGLELIDGDILCHTPHQGTYTDIGATAESTLVDQLSRAPWREVVRERFARSQPWLFRIITDPSRARMLDVLNPPVGGNFLDVGSGWGQVALPLARRGAVFALDQTIGRLRILREIARQEGAHVNLLCGDVHTFPLRRGFFDLIIVNGALEYMCIGRGDSDRDAHVAALHRLADALAPAGRLYVGIENAIGLKYLLGAPDDHTGRSGFTYREQRPDGAAARTWSLDQYRRIFADAGLVVDAAYGCFPDYKLIRHMVPLDEVDDFLLGHGLPAEEHSGVDGAPLSLSEELRSLYTSFARQGIARHFVPSFGFVLGRADGASLRSPRERDRVRQAAAEMALEAGLVDADAAAEIAIHPTTSDVAHRPEARTARYSVLLRGRTIASLKVIPNTDLFDLDAVLAVYEEFKSAKTFRPVKLHAHRRDERGLMLLEEFIDNARSLDDLVREGVCTPDEATRRVVSVVDDVYALGSPADAEQVESELAEVREAFRELFEDSGMSESVSRAFCDMIRAGSATLRTALTTRDYIGRNLVLADDRQWVLLDYDLARRTSLFFLGVARNVIQTPYATPRLLSARAFDGLDAVLAQAAAIAAEYALQRMVAPTSQQETLRSQFRLHFLRLWAPAEVTELTKEPAHRRDELFEARDYQQRLERDIENARQYQRNLERHVAGLEATLRAGVMPRVDIMVVAYNSSRWIEGFVDSLKNLDYPTNALRLIFVDNGSRDDTVAKMEQLAAGLHFSMELIHTGKNLGFTGGYEHAMRYGDGDFYFVVNLDTVIAPDVIRLLVQRMTEDPAVGIAEARQAPREHPKYYDPVTGETSWCSGACMMVRPRAMRQVGGGFLKSFFMYLEDIDLSWRMWIGGWKCVYVPEAVVQHFTEDLDPKKTPKLQHYYTMRNGALMRAMYGAPSDVLLHYLAMLRVATFSRNPLWHKWGTLKAIFASLPRLPRAILERRFRGRRGKHRWVFFNGWTYGRHARDLSLSQAKDERVVMDLLGKFPDARIHLDHDLPIDGHVTTHPGANVGGESRPALLVYDTAEVTYEVRVAPGQELCGAVAIPMECWSAGGAARFTVSQDGREILTREVSPGELAHRQWLSFSVPLVASEGGCLSRVALRFAGNEKLAWGLWGSPRVVRPAPAVTDDSWRERLETPAVSVVMPTHNRADQLPRVVARLMAQDLAPEHYEVIIVDSNSSDATPRVLESLKARYPNLATLRCERSSVAATRNMGLNVARAPLILLLDDDILVGRDLLSRALRTAHRHPGKVLLARIVAPWQDACDPFERFLWQSQDVNVYNFDDPEHVPPSHFYTACVVIPREVLGDTRFDENFIAAGVEDIEFGFRLLSEDARMVFMPDVEVQHEYYPAYRPYRRKKLRHGYLLGYFLAQHPEHTHRFVFERKIVRYHHGLRLVSILAAPGAALLYVLERIRYAPRALLRPLYLWTYVDLRLCMYRGLRLFRQGRPLP